MSYVDSGAEKNREVVQPHFVLSKNKNKYKKYQIIVINELTFSL